MVGPRILILDEPLSGVDTESRAAITELLLQLNREEKKAIVFSSHDLRMVRSVTKKILRVDDGKVRVGGGGGGLIFHGELSRDFQSLLLAFSGPAWQRDTGRRLSAGGSASDSTPADFSRLDVAASRGVRRGLHLLDLS